MSLLKLRKVHVSDKIASECLEAFKGKGVEVTYKPGLSKTELLDIIPEYNGLIVRSATKVTADVIRAAVNLEVCIFRNRYSWHIEPNILKVHSSNYFFVNQLF